MNKKLMTTSSSKLQNEQSEVLCLQNRKAFHKVHGIIILYPKQCSLEESIVVIMWKSINMFPLQSQISKHTLKILFRS